MPVYRYDTKLKEMVKISDKSYRNAGSVMEKPFCEQVMNGYKAIEAKGNTVWGRPAGIKRIWGN